MIDPSSDRSILHHIVLQFRVIIFHAIYLCYSFMLFILFYSEIFHNGSCCPVWWASWKRVSYNFYFILFILVLKRYAVHVSLIHAVNICIFLAHRNTLPTEDSLKSSLTPVINAKDQSGESALYVLLRNLNPKDSGSSDGTQLLPQERFLSLFLFFPVDLLISLCFLCCSW